MNKHIMDALAKDLRSKGRLPGGYVWQNDGWVHCLACCAGAMWPGEIPGHANDCAVKQAEDTHSASVNENSESKRKDQRPMSEGTLTAGTAGELRPDAAPEHIAQFFAYEHLPQHLQAVSAPFASLASVVLELPRNPERTVALRKLLEAKDAAVRAALAK